MFSIVWSLFEPIIDISGSLGDIPALTSYFPIATIALVIKPMSSFLVGIFPKESNPIFPNGIDGLVFTSTISHLRVKTF